MCMFSICLSAEEIDLEAEIKDIADIRANLLCLLKHQQRLREVVRRGVDSHRLDPNVADVQLALNGVVAMNKFVKEKNQELDRLEECIQQCMNQRKCVNA